MQNLFFIKNKSMKIIISILLSFITLTGFSSEFSLSNAISFYSFYGNYISADKEKKSILIADRAKRGEWEAFYIEILKGNKCAIKTFDAIYLRVDTLNRNALFADRKKISEECIFEIDYKNDFNRISLKAYNNKYVSISKDRILVADAVTPPLINSLYSDFNNKNFNIASLSSFQLFLLINSLLIITLSVFAFYFKKNINFSLILLILGGISLRLLAVYLDPFLNIWDERFHALVAKNMIDNPLKPMLFKNPVLPYNYENWTSNYIWLHKQPLFLWQISFFFKILGVSEFVLRVPSLIMSSITIIFIYRIGKIIANQNIAYISALFFTSSYYTIELVSGKMSTDHNDLSFMFYITASLWAYFEYLKSDKLKWVVLIGLFAGLAILNKWLVGLLVYSAWGLNLLLIKENRKRLKKYIYLIVSLSICIIVVLPWQLYINKRFPIESNHEHLYNLRHLTEPIEKHSDTFMFHLNQTIDIYGLHYLIVLLSILLINKLIKKSEYKIAFNTYILIVYLFYTLVATKMYSFTFCISSLVYISISGLFFYLIDNNKVLSAYLTNNKVYLNVIKSIFLIMFSFYLININQIITNHKDNTIFRSDFNSQNKIHNPIYQKFDKLIPGNDYVIFNTPLLENINIMFYTKFTAYDFPLTIDIYNELKSKKVKMATFDNGNLPDFIKNDKDVFIIK